MGRKPTPDPAWYVYMEDFNEKTIKMFNVFHSHRFLEGCRKSFKRYGNDYEKLEAEIMSWAKYSFWSKSEYEIILTSFPPTPPGRTFYDVKIDVFDQLALNWNSFFEYVLKHKAYFLRRNK